MQSNNQLLHLNFLQPYHCPCHSVIIFEISLCWPSWLCGLTGVQWGLGTEWGPLLSVVAILEPSWADLHLPHHTDTPHSTPEKGVGPPQALSASLSPLPGAGSVTEACGCLFPPRGPCHSLSSDILQRYC